jgi:hypothetical protein
LFNTIHEQLRPNGKLIIKAQFCRFMGLAVEW